MCVKQIKLILSGHTGREGKHDGHCLTHEQLCEPASSRNLREWLHNAITSHDFFHHCHFWMLFRSSEVFLHWAVACSWNPTVVSVLPPPHWGRSYLLTAESLRGVWSFPCSLPSAYSLRYPPTVLDQENIRPFVNEEWTPMSYKINFVPSSHSQFLPKWHGMARHYTQAHK